MNNKALIIVILILIIFGGYVVYVNQLRFPVPNQATSPTDTVSPTAVSCDVPQDVTQGPYYISNTARLKDNALNYTNLAGIPIKITGHVYIGTSTVPIPNAKIELWQADSGGFYHPNANGKASDFSADELALRGYILTDDAGYYEFYSIYPGYYEGRVRHIHAKVTAQNHKDSVTQLIFMPKEGDGTTIDTDSIAQTLPKCNVVNLTKSGDLDVGTYDFRVHE